MLTRSRKKPVAGCFDVLGQVTDGRAQDKTFTTKDTKSHEGYTKGLFSPGAVRIRRGAERSFINPGCELGSRRKNFSTTKGT
jgi:hypothetical protein